MTSGLTLDAGALLALERADERVRALLRRSVQQGWELHIRGRRWGADVAGRSPSGATGPTARGKRGQSAPLDEVMARAVGVLCGRAGHADIVDVHVALHAREHGHAVVTSDPNDIALVDPSLTVITV